MNHQPSRWRPWAFRLGMLLGLPAAATTTLGFVGSLWWVLDLLSHFRMYYAVTLVVALVLCALRQPQRWVGSVVMGLLAVAMMANVILIAPLYLPAEPSGRTDPEDPTLTLLHFNVHTRNPRHEQVIDYIEQSDVDMVFLQEVSAGWLVDLAARCKRYRVQVARPKEDNFGIAMLVPTETQGDLSVVRAQIVDFSQGMGDLPAIEVVIDWQGRQVKVLSLHTLPPVGAWAAHIRDTQLAAVGQWASDQTVPVIIIGDFNATRWSVGYRLLMRQPDLIDSQRGHGYSPTFPSRGPIQIPIDLCVHSHQLATVDRHVGPSHGSDHRSLKITFGWVGP